MADNGIHVDIQSNIDKFTEAEKDQLQKALIAIGIEAEGYAKEDCPVDTGRLRNSITYATSTSTGSGAGEDSAVRQTPDEYTVAVGTNVEYAPEQELISMPHKVGKPHFLRDSLTKNPEHWKAIIEAALKS